MMLLERLRVKSTFFLNGEIVNIKTFNDYIDLYLKDRYFDESNKVEYTKLIAPHKE